MSDVDKYSLYPLRDYDMYLLGKKQEARKWGTSEIKSFAVDREDCSRMEQRRERMVSKIYMLFVPIDGVINAGHMKRTCEDWVTPEEQFAMTFQFMIEAVHAETYGLYAQAVFGNDKLKAMKIEAQNTPCIQNKIKFLEKYSSSQYSPQEYLLAFACSEGIHISTSFIVIFWFRSQNLLPVAILTNSMISEDEFLHQLIANTRYLKHPRLSEEREMEIIMEAMELEREYLKWLLPEAIDDLKPEDLDTYLKLIIDYQLISIKRDKIYNVTNPFVWDLDRSLYKKPNPYERDSGEYTHFNPVQEVERLITISEGNQVLETHLSDPWSVQF